MEIKIQEEKQNPFFEREEVKGTVESDKTPSKAEIQTAVAEKTKKSADVIVVKNIYPNYGSYEAKFYVYIYKTPEAKLKYEPKIKVKTEKAKKAAPKKA